jgi:glutamate decarboxylase
MTEYHVIDSTYATRYMVEPIPKLKMPEQGIPADVVSQLIRDMRTLDAHPNLNLASFVCTFVEREAKELMMESLDVNFVGNNLGNNHRRAPTELDCLEYLI